MNGRQKYNKGASQVGEQPTVDTYQGRANKFYNMKQSGQTAAVVETVFRKPKPFANLHEYDDTETVDQVPTAIGFQSFDSAEEVIEAKMKSRYHFEEPAKKEKPQESEGSGPMEKERVSSKENKPTPTSSEQMHVPFHKVILRKVEQRSPSEKVEEKRPIVAPEERQGVGEKKNEKEKKEEVEDEFKGDDRYGLGKSIFSDDDSCPPLWKSFSNDNDGKRDAGEAAIEEKARRENALNEARKLRALNSVNGAESTPFETEIGMDPRLRRNRTQESYQKKTDAIKKRSSKRTVADAEDNCKMRHEFVQKNVVNSNRNGKDPVSIVSNSIIASQTPPRKVAVKAITVNSRFDDASYGSEGQSKASEDDKHRTMSAGTLVQAATEQSFAACVYEGLTNLTNINYWIGEQASIDGSQEGSDDGSREAVKNPSNVHWKGGSKRDSSATKAMRPAIVSEITIPTPAVGRKGEPHMEDSVSILGLDKKQSNMESMGNGENHVPQKQKKRKGKSRVFGKILGRKSAA